jgi:hypothetical protein
MWSKLTLTVNSEVISRARRYAKSEGISVSRMVEAYLSAVTQAAGAGPDAPLVNSPIVNSLRGILRNADVTGYRKHLEDKYL